MRAGAGRARRLAGRLLVRPRATLRRAGTARHIQRGLQDRDIFIRICTPAALASGWIAQEQTLARTMRAPNRDLRRMINLIVKPGYVVSAGEAQDRHHRYDAPARGDLDAATARGAGDSLTRATGQSAGGAGRRHHLTGGARRPRPRGQTALLHSSRAESLLADWPSAYRDPTVWNLAHPLAILDLSSAISAVPQTSPWPGRPSSPLQTVR